MVDPSYLSLLLVAIFITFAIPLLALILFGVRVAFNGRPMNRSVSFGLLIIWLLGVSTSIFYIAKVSSEFKEEAEFTQVMPLKRYPVYTLELNNSRFFSKEDSIRYKINAEGYKGKIILDDQEGPFNTRGNVRINIVKSLDSMVSVSQNYSAHGKTFELALRNAQNIQYDFKQQDSLLNFSSNLHLDKHVNWRDQEVRITVKIPVGTKLILSEKLDRYLNQYGSWACNEEGNQDRDYIEWVMTEEGLKCQYELNQGTHQHDQ